MGSLNQVNLIGNLGRDAEVRYTPGGAAVAKFSMAMTETWTGKDGSKQSRTEWVNVELWGKQAESLSEYLKKGKQVYVQGRLQTDEWEKDGEKKRATKVRCDRVVQGAGGQTTEASDRVDLCGDAMTGKEWLAALAIRCPRCGAVAGQFCGTLLHPHAHPERVEAAELKRRR